MSYLTSEKPKKFTVLKVDDWAALYIDGEKTDYEHHNITLRDVQDKSEGKAIFVEERWVDGTACDQYVVDNGEFPAKLSDVDETKVKVNNPWA